MATAFVFEADMLTRQHYDGMMAAMGMADPDGPYPDGLVVHLSGARPDGGWRVIDVWESDEAAAAFYGSERFAPVRDGAGTGAITSTPWPLYRIEARAASRERV
jgi:hypothetical protein